MYVCHCGHCVCVCSFIHGSQPHFLFFSSFPGTSRLGFQCSVDRVRGEGGGGTIVCEVWVWGQLGEVCEVIGCGAKVHIWVIGRYRAHKNVLSFACIHTFICMHACLVLIQFLYVTSEGQQN